MNESENDYGNPQTPWGLSLIDSIKYGPEEDIDTAKKDAPKYKPSIRLLLCTPNFQKRGKNIFKHNKYFKVLYRTDVTQNNKHHLIVDMKTEPTSRKNWSELKEFCSNGTKSYESRKIRDQNQLNDLKIKHNMIQC